MRSVFFFQKKKRGVEGGRSPFREQLSNSNGTWQRNSLDVPDSNGPVHLCAVVQCCWNFVHTASIARRAFLQ